MGTYSWSSPVIVLLCVVFSYWVCMGVTDQTYDSQRKKDKAMEGVLATYSCTVDKPSCHLEDVQCSTDSDCHDALPNLAMAIGMGKIYPQPTAPVCNTDLEEKKGHCSCKDNQCVSYSKKFGSNVVFYYCGPCGFVGSQCSSNISCTHEQSECRSSFCKCKKEGEFYEISYCKLPYVRYETALQIVIIMCIVSAACVLLATIYNASSLRKEFGSLTQLCTHSREQQNPQEPPNSDVPPAYDDVVESLPSYQDALQASPRSSIPAKKVGDEDWHRAPPGITTKNKLPLWGLVVCKLNASCHQHIHMEHCFKFLSDFHCTCKDSYVYVKKCHLLLGILGLTVWKPSF